MQLRSINFCSPLARKSVTHNTFILDYVAERANKSMGEICEITAHDWLKIAIHIH